MNDIAERLYAMTNEAAREIERLKADRDLEKQLRKSWVDRCAELEAENAALVAALDKIAERTGSDDPCAQLVHMARKALRDRFARMKP